MCNLSLTRGARATAPLALAAACLMLTAAAYAQAADQQAGGQSNDAAVAPHRRRFPQGIQPRGCEGAVPALWTENGSLSDDGGQTFKGRKAIEEQYAAFLKSIAERSWKSPSSPSNSPLPTWPSKTALPWATDKDGALPAASRYTAVHVLHDGTWLMASVRESNIEIPTNYG